MGRYYSASPDTLPGFQGPTSKGKGKRVYRRWKGRGEREEKERNGVEGRGSMRPTAKGREWKREEKEK